MNYKKIGLFIESQRKAKGLTQAKLAKKLYVSDKTVSKWENGRGLPDTAIIIRLCKILEISVNELLSGEKLADDSYKLKAEDNITNLLTERKTNKQKIIFSVIYMSVCLSIFLVCAFIVSFLKMDTWLKICLMVYGSCVLVFGMAIITYYDIKVGTFECSKCKQRFTPSITAYLLGPHLITKRFLKCPHCGKYSFCKKKLTK